MLRVGSGHLLRASDTAVSRYLKVTKPRLDHSWHECSGAEEMNAFIKTQMPASFSNNLSALQDELNITNATDVLEGRISINKVDNSSATVGSVCGQIPITFPLSALAADALYARMAQSQVGVEGRGDVMDAERRQSKECPLHPSDNCLVQVSQQVLDFDFPDARKRIRDSFCRHYTSTTSNSDHPAKYHDIEYRPYKFVLYSAGDYFAPHRDSMSDENQIGSLAVQVPVQQASPSESDPVSNEVSGGNDIGGQLIFYLGRPDGGARVLNDENPPEICTQKGELKLSIDLTSPLPQPRDSEGTVEVKYAAWLGDILHEVTGVTKNYRAVLLYRLYRTEGSGDPSANEVSGTDIQCGTLLSQIMDTMRHVAGEVTVPEVQQPQQPEHVGWFRRIMRSVTFAGKTPVKVPHRPPEYLGVILRHAYPPAGLVPSGLKGCDSALYAIASREYNVSLHSGFEYRFDYAGSPFRANGEDGSFAKTVLLTSDRLDELYDMNVRRADTYAYHPVPVMIGGVWIQLGFGVVVDGGYCLGNYDCGSDWWYRSAFMVIQPKP